MRKKLLSITAVIAVIFIAAVLFRVDRFIYGDRLNWAEAQARSQLVAIHQALQIEMKSLQRIVFTFNTDNFRKEKINWNSLQPYYAVASLSVSPQGDIEVQNLLVKEKSPAYNWNADFVNKALAQSGLKPTQNLQVFAKPFQDAGKGRHVAMLFASGSKAYALIGAGEAFQSLVDAQKGSLSAFSIVTSNGLTVAHSVPEYVGTLVSDDAVFKAAKEGGSSQGAGVFDAEGNAPRFGVYDQIPNTNLLILSSVPVADLMKGRAGLMWQFVFLGMGLMLVGVGGMLFVILPQERSLEQLRLRLRSLVSGKKDFHPKGLTEEVQELDELVSSIPQTVAPPPSAVVTTAAPTVAPKEGGEASFAADKMAAYRKVASALGHEMRGPLTSILGHSQVVLANSENPEVVSSIDSIVRESRSARHILEKLFSFAGEQTSEKNQMKIEGPLARALKKMEPIFQEKGVKVIREIESATAFPLSADDLTQAFENIFLNSVEAMERMPKKELSVRVWEDADGVHFRVADTGEGMDGKDLTQAFDPFFTTRSFQNHVGLGLAVVMGIFKDHQAEATLTSERGNGTTFEAVFVLNKDKKAPAPKLAGNLAGNDFDNQLEKTVSDIPLPTSLPPAPAAAHREAEEKISLQKATNVAPTEVNIESLLELPPVGQGSDEFSFIDGFLDDQPKAPAKPAPAKSTSKTPPPLPISETKMESENVSEAAMLQQVMEAPMDQDLPPPPLAGPKRAPPKKNSALDSYQVEIRKPGKRP